MVFLNYQVNKGYFAQNLCVERDKPMSMCLGSCQLDAQIRIITETGTGEAATIFNVSLSEEYVADVVLNISKPIVGLIITSFNNHFSDNYFYSFFIEVFHPPIA